MIKLVRIGICISAPLLLSGVAGSADVFVSPTGHDTNAGTLNAPFATLERARDAVRVVNVTGLPIGGITVWLRGGDFIRTNTFLLGAADSGAPLSPVTYRSYPGEEARLLGGVTLQPEWFSAVSTNSPAWGRLDAVARGNVMEVDLGSHGITNHGTLLPRGFYLDTHSALELFFSNAPMQLARWPDVGEHQAAPSPTNSQLTIFGSLNPDVTGTYVADGTSDGLNSYSRVGLVDGKQYHFYRHSWTWDVTNSATCWFLTTAASGQPGPSDPFWFRYNTNIGLMDPATDRGASGAPTFADPERIANGMAKVATGISSTCFGYAGTRPERWTQAEDPWFHGLWMYDWADYHLAGGAIDTNARMITIDAIPQFGVQAGQSYYAYNLLEEITEPGEWYLNRSTGILYFWPPAPLTSAAIRVSMLEVPLWSQVNTTNVVVRDLTFDMGRTTLVSIDGGRENRLLGCRLRNAGSAACTISGISNGLSACEITDPGDGGVRISGGDRASLSACGNFVRGTRVQGFGRWAWTYKPAVHILDESVGVSVIHNEFAHAPHTAVLFGRGNNHDIAYNEICDVCREACDAGAVYAGRDWAARGNAVRYNFIHDLTTAREGYGVNGIYLDDCQSGVSVIGNVLYRISNFAIQMGGGRDNLMENNVIVKCGYGVYSDGRAGTWMFASGNTYALWSNLQTYPYQGALWSNAYPACAALPNQWSVVTNGTWLSPEGNTFSRNIGYGNGIWMGEENNAYSFYEAVSNNMPDTDPLFEDEAGLNLALRTNSPAYSIPGFEAIPFASIGLENPYPVEIQAQGDGAVTLYPAGSNLIPMQPVVLAATPATYWYFSGWAGAVTGPAPVVAFVATQALTATATFLPYVTSNGVPLWWLAGNGLSTNEAGAVADSDGDGCANWQEYIAGSDPVDANSRLGISTVGAAGPDALFRFGVVTNRRYTVEYRSGLTDTNGWRPLTSTIPITATALEIEDDADATTRFYRVRVELP